MANEATTENNKVSPWKLLFGSRKGVAYFLMIFLIGVAGIGFTVVALRAAWRGEMKLVEAMQFVMATVVGAMGGGVVLTFKLLDTIKEEDVARIQARAPVAPTVQVAAGDGAKVSSTTEAVTDPQSPTAIKEAESSEKPPAPGV